MRRERDAGPLRRGALAHGRLTSGLDRLGFVLYGGRTAALRLGRRREVDFAFFCARPPEKERLISARPVFQGLPVAQEAPNTLSAVWSSAAMAQDQMKLSLFGGYGPD